MQSLQARFEAAKKSPPGSRAAWKEELRESCLKRAREARADRFRRPRCLDTDLQDMTALVRSVVGGSIPPQDGNTGIDMHDDKTYEFADVTEEGMSWLSRWAHFHCGLTGLHDGLPHCALFDACSCPELEEIALSIMEDMLLECEQFESERAAVEEAAASVVDELAGPAVLCPLCKTRWLTVDATGDIVCACCFRVHITVRANF